MKFGVDYLGGRHYEKAMLITHPPLWSGGIFLRTFGDARSTLEKMCRSGKFSEIVVHLAPFDNSHRYELNKYLPNVRRDALWCEGLSRKYPNVVLMLSVFCEHNHSAKTMKPVFDGLKRIAPSCLMVNSIWKGEVVPGVITEIHLENSKPKRKPPGEYLVSFDGIGGDGEGDFTDVDVPKLLNIYSDARHIRLWNFRYNGKFGHKDTTPIAQRKCWPSVEYLKGHNAMMKNREGEVSYPANALYKPFADDHGQGGKDNKAMVICQKAAPSLKVFDSNGKHIDTMRRVTPDHTGDPRGPRYYSDKYAYQIANIAQQNTGSRKIRIGSLPLTDGDLRSSRFR